MEDGFALVEFDRYRDAEDAVEELPSEQVLGKVNSYFFFTDRE